MLILNYIPNGNKGTITPDGDVEATVREWIEQSKGIDLVIKVGHALPITCVRALVKEGVLTQDDVKFRFKDDVELYCDNEGRIDYWPTGFCDYEDDMLTRLLGWDKCDDSGMKVG